MEASNAERRTSAAHAPPAHSVSVAVSRHVAHLLRTAAGLEHACFPAWAAGMADALVTRSLPAMRSLNSGPLKTVIDACASSMMGASLLSVSRASLLQAVFAPADCSTHQHAQAHSLTIVETGVHAQDHAAPQSRRTALVDSADGLSADDRDLAHGIVRAEEEVTASTSVEALLEARIRSYVLAFLFVLPPLRAALTTSSTAFLDYIITACALAMLVDDSLDMAVDAAAGQRTVFTALPHDEAMRIACSLALACERHACALPDDAPWTFRLLDTLVGGLVLDNCGIDCGDASPCGLSLWLLTVFQLRVHPARPELPFDVSAFLRAFG